VSTSSEQPAAPEPAQQSPTSEQRALLDTTVQIDRKKTESRRSKLEEMLARYGWRFSTGISLVEFKATLIQECLTIHNQLRRTGASFTRVRDALLEKKGQQIALRAHIFNNIIQIYGSSFEITEEEDRRFAEKARLLLENIIPQLYHWFAKESVDAVLNERLGCNRANEPPHKKKAAFEVNLPDCKRGKNKTCSVEAVIRSDGPQLLRSLQPHLAQSEQLQNAAKVFQDVIDNPRRELSHGDCRNAGDCLIALEAKDKSTHALSSNAREWAPISAAMGYEFVQIAYPEEQSK
jgi:hypothetical protein